MKRRDVISDVYERVLLKLSSLLEMVAIQRLLWLESSVAVKFLQLFHPSATPFIWNSNLTVPDTAEDLTSFGMALQQVREWKSNIFLSKLFKYFRHILVKYFSFLGSQFNSEVGNNLCLKQTKLGNCQICSLVTRYKSKIKLRQLTLLSTKIFQDVEVTWQHRVVASALQTILNHMITMLSVPGGSWWGEDQEFMSSSLMLTWSLAQVISWNI